MTSPAIGLLWGLAFILLESVQYVFFGNVFQRMSSYLFGALVFGITSVVFIGIAGWRTPGQLLAAWRNLPLLLAINVTATLSWVAFLSAVQMIEPAVAYTLGAGAMPLTAYVAYRVGVPEGEPMRNRLEGAGNLIILISLVVLGIVTITGLSGFVRGGSVVALVGVMLALGEGALFTWLLILCQRIDRCGVGPGAVFGLRFPLYVMVAGGLAVTGVEHKVDLSVNEIVVIIGIGLLLIVPPLYALQRAVALISTLTISALTALGPFLIFGFQMIEGRVDYAPATLFGLVIYFLGAMLAALGAVRATIWTST